MCVPDPTETVARPCWAAWIIHEHGRSPDRACRGLGVTPGDLVGSDEQSTAQRIRVDMTDWFVPIGVGSELKKALSGSRARAPAGRRSKVRRATSDERRRQTQLTHLKGTKVTGFKNFILRGNLVEIAVAFIMATAFALVVTATVTVIMDLIGKVGGTPNFSHYAPGGVSVGAWITAVISFLILAAVVYFLVIVPYTKAKERYFPAEPEGLPADVAMLTEIRDLLARIDSRGPGGAHL